MVALAMVLVQALPAWGHTSLLDSTPANLSRLDSPPTTLHLEFTDPVDPHTVTVSILDVEGNSYEGASRSTTGEPTSQVSFTLPELVEGTYGVAWQSIGSDGHRAAGEVVFGVGAVTPDQLGSARFQTVSTQDRVVDAAGAMGRLLWYLGLSLAVGALFTLHWLAGAPQTWTDAGQSLWKVGRKWLWRGLRLAMLGAAVRLIATVSILAGTLESGSTAARIGETMVTGRPVFEMIVLLMLAVAFHFAAGVSETPRSRQGDHRWRNVAIGVSLAVVAGSVGGHLAVNRAPEIAAAVSAAHILAAALWIGPLCVIALWMTSRKGHDLPPGERSELLGAYFPRFARAAGWSLVVLVVTGVEALWANLGTNLFANRYGLTLTAKIVLLLVVILPLAWAHDRRVRSAPDSLGDRRFARGVRLEVAGLAAVLVLASSLALLNPTAGGAGLPGGTDDLLSADPVTDVGECAELSVGQSNCYRSYFSALMRRENAGAAVARVLELSQSDPFIASQCHQITHDIGREAADHYRTLGEALSFEASACWSGYYHGVVEQNMSQYDDARLLEMVPQVCAEAARNLYSFTHYNCVHGVGHGIMLRFDSDLFQSIPYCERLTDPWELSSCISGTFMQNVVSAQEGHSGATFQEGDLVYPCNAVDHQYKDECFGMQTSYILWMSDHDLAAGFEVCDTVEAEFIGDCYQSMGRDISGSSLLDPPQVVEGCALGQQAHREHCIVGAALNAVFNDHNPDKANELCAIVEEDYRAACLAARDRALSSF